MVYIRLSLVNKTYLKCRQAYAFRQYHVHDTSIYQIPTLPLDTLFPRQKRLRRRWYLKQDGHMLQRLLIQQDRIESSPYASPRFVFCIVKIHESHGDSNADPSNICCLGYAGDPPAQVIGVVPDFEPNVDDQVFA